MRPYVVAALVVCVCARMGGILTFACVPWSFVPHPWGFQWLGRTLPTVAFLIHCDKLEARARTPPASLPSCVARSNAVGA